MNFFRMPEALADNVQVKERQKTLSSFQLNGTIYDILTFLVEFASIGYTRSWYWVELLLVSSEGVAAAFDNSLVNHRSRPICQLYRQQLLYRQPKAMNHKAGHFQEAENPSLLPAGYSSNNSDRERKKVRYISYSIKAPRGLQVITHSSIVPVEEFQLCCWV